MIARIYTENTKPILDWIKENIPNCTILNGIGLWRGAEEKSLILEIIGDFDEKIVMDLARAIKLVGNQAAVLVSIIRDEHRLI